MSNPGLIVLAVAPSTLPNLKRFVIEDNIGEAIHIHWNEIRLDFTIEEFLCFSNEVRLNLEKLSSHGIANLTQLPSIFLNSLGNKVLHIREIRTERRLLNDLRITFKNDTNGNLELKTLRELNNEELIKITKNKKFACNAETEEGISNEHQPELSIVLFENDDNVQFGADKACDLKLRNKTEFVEISIVCFDKAPNKTNVENAGSRSTHLEPPLSQLMLLAGMPGSGKSTLLKKSIIEKKALFGKLFDEAFQKTKLPQTFPEDNLSLEERLKLGTWVHENDLLKLHSKPQSKQDLVVHFDLYSFLFNASSWNPSLSYVKNSNEFKEFLLDSDRVSEIFSIVFKLNPVLKRKCQIATLKPLYDDVCARWVERETHLNRWKRSNYFIFVANYIYNNNNEGRAIYENIYASWYKVLPKF